VSHRSRGGLFCSGAVPDAREEGSSDVALLVDARFVCSPTLFFELSLPNTFDELFDSRSLGDWSAGAEDGCSDVLEAAELGTPPLLPA
jgi:hypothetical protein